MNKPYRLKADSREAIEQAIPFDLDVPARKDYSYKFLGHYEEEEAVYEDGKMVKEPVMSDYVLADLMDYRDDAPEIDFGADVKKLDVESPMHGWV